MTNLAPIALFVYARPDETIKTIESLKNNYLAAESELYIFSDGSKGEKDFHKVSEVRKVINSITSGFRKVRVIEREKNFGLANSIITGVSEILNEYDKIIVIEEDLISSKNFLNFLNASLVKYENDDRVFSVTGYTYNIQIPQTYTHDNYFTPRCESLGWGTWRNRWLKADWNMKDFRSFLSDKKSILNFSEIGSDLPGMLFKQQLGKVDSWAVRWCYTHFKYNAFCSYPVKSKIVHIGEGGLATHVKKELKFLETELDNELKTSFNFSDNIKIEPEIFSQFKVFFRKSFSKKIRNLFLRSLLLWKTAIK